MRAMSIDRFGGPEVLHPIEAELPEPGPGQVRVRVAFAGCNPMDAKIRSGASFFPINLPAVLGREFSGVVDALGAGASGTPGDRVAGLADVDHGTYAEYTLATLAVPVPASVPLDQAAAVPIAAGTASRVLAELGIAPGEVVLINGASGAVGAMAVQLALARGATVIGSAGAAHLHELTGLGATATTYGPGLVERVRALTTRVDAAFDVAGRGSLPDLIDLCGGTSRVITIADGQAARYGVRFSTGQGFGHDAEHIASALQLLADADLTVRVGRSYPLAMAADAHRAMAEATVRGKILLQP